MKGHTYYLFDPAHLDGAALGNALLVGDSLGLAQPLTAEGILPSVISGRVAAEAILAGAPGAYPDRLRAHPVMADYGRVFRARQVATTVSRRSTGPVGTRSRLARRALARGFVWMFSGARLPAPRLVDAGLALAESWAERHRDRMSAS